MRRRYRQSTSTAPLGIVVDCTASAGFGKRDFEKRGAAILALVRVLSQSRPVTLHVACGLAANEEAKGYYDLDATWIVAQVDTAPLDLARASYVMSAPGFLRGLCFGIAKADYGFVTRWPYGDVEAIRPHGHKIFEGIVPGAEEVLYVPPMHYQDPLSSKPEEWLKDMVAKYGNPEEE
jgi:hypothetical protein